jgi:capsular exopolysaccharide synthesis family protein
LVYVYLKTVNDIYKVQSTITLRKEKGMAGMLDMSMVAGLGLSTPSSKEVEDEIQILVSKSLTSQMIKELGIETEYFKKDGWKYIELYPSSPIKLLVPNCYNDTTKIECIQFEVEKVKVGYEISIRANSFSKTFSTNSINSKLPTPYGDFKLVQIGSINDNSSYKICSYSVKYLIDRYNKDIKVASLNKKSNGISIISESSCPKKSEIIINKLVDLYNTDEIIDKNQLATNTAKFIEERLKLISSDLLNEELKVERYKKVNKLTDLESEAGLFLEASSDYEKKLAEIETQLNLVSNIESYIKDNRNQYSTVPLNMGVKDESVLTVMQEYNKALLERMRIMRSSNDKNPVIAQMEMQLKEMRANILLTMSSVKEGLKISKNDLLSKGKQFDSKIKAVPTQERQYIEIKRQQEIKEKLYLYLLQKREENALSLANTVPTAKINDAAYTTNKPIAPRRIILYGIGLILGLFIPIVVLYIIELLNDTISDKKEFKKIIKAPYIGSLIMSKDTERVVVKEGNTSTLVEMFRLVRTNLQFMLSGKKSPVILVTSSVSGEGKSFISINLSMSLALTSKKVVLVGLDIRNPMLGEYMHISKNKGATLFLSDNSYQLNDIIIPSGFHPNLDVIPAGPIPPNPAELLIDTRLEELIDNLKLTYDYIILDSAPIGMVSDTFLINRVVDNTVYVSRQAYTPREMVELINEVYETKKLNNMSVVFNGVDEASSGFSHGVGYGYGRKD